MKTVVLPLLKEQRESRHWTQETLAELAGIAVRTVQRAEKQGSISVDAAMAIAGAMDLKDYKQLTKPENTIKEDPYSSTKPILQPLPDKAAHEKLQSTSATSAPQPPENLIFMTKDDKEFLDSSRFRTNLLAGLVGLFALLSFIKKSPNEATIIGLTLLIGLVIVTLTKKKVPGKSWFRTWSINKYVAVPVAITSMIVMVLMMGSGLDKMFAKQSIELALISSVNHAHDAIFILEDKKTFQNIPEDAKLKDVLNTETKSHQKLTVKLESWQRIYKERSEKWPEVCLVMPASGNGKRSSIFDMTIRQVKTTLKNFAWDCSLEDDD